MSIRHDRGFLIFDIIPPPLPATVGVETLCSLLKPSLYCQDFHSKTYPFWKPPIALQSTGVGESSRSLREEFCWDERSNCQLGKTEEISVNVIRIGHTKGGGCILVSKEQRRSLAQDFLNPKKVFVHKRPQIGPFECGRSCVTFQVSIGRGLNLINAAYGLFSKQET